MVIILHVCSVQIVFYKSHRCPPQRFTCKMEWGEGGGGGPGAGGQGNVSHGVVVIEPNVNENGLEARVTGEVKPTHFSADKILSENTP